MSRRNLLALLMLLLASAIFTSALPSDVAASTNTVNGYRIKVTADYDRETNSILVKVKITTAGSQLPSLVTVRLEGYRWDDPGSWVKKFDQSMTVTSSEGSLKARFSVPYSGTVSYWKFVATVSDTLTGSTLVVGVLYGKCCTEFQDEDDPGLPG